MFSWVLNWFIKCSMVFLHVQFLFSDEWSKLGFQRFDPKTPERVPGRFRRLRPRHLALPRTSLEPGEVRGDRLGVF